MMIRHPLGLRLDPNHSTRDQVHEAARLGARGVVLDAVGELAPHRLSVTGRRELRHVLSSVELPLVALSLPTRRPFDTTDQLDDRVRRADSAFAMAYELGTTVVLVRAGAVPPVEEPARREVFSSALRALGVRAEHRGVRLALETGSEPPEQLRSFLETMILPGLAASIDPAAGLQTGMDPIASVRELAAWVVHAYANDATASPHSAAANPRGFGFPPGALDWEEYLGALEEIGYRGFLTFWPVADRLLAAQWTALAHRLEQLG
jgi:sugar phosphate isomerase/epimerase